MKNNDLDYSLDDFDFNLPNEQIAQYPLTNRSASRLLCLDKSQNTIHHHYFHEISRWLRPQDMLVFNDTRVIPARLYGNKASGGSIECLIERVQNSAEALAHVRASHAPLVDSLLHLANGNITVKVIKRVGDLFQLRLVKEGEWMELLNLYGEIPLPKYISRSAEALDLERYQTVYAKKMGAVAAPTAGLHFDAALLTQLKQQDIDFEYITLHVGAGTFQPVRTLDLNQHIMHSERIELSEASCCAINACRQRGGRVFAVGTTVARCLETAFQQGRLQPYQGETRLFIRPGFTFRGIDALITNFHLPKSTLLMLVCAFGGYDATIAAYREAVAKGYRFFSYGDAMLLI